MGIHKLINIVLADAIKSDGVFIGKIKNNPVLIINRKSPEIAQFALKFMSLKMGVKRVFAKNLLFLFGGILNFGG